MIFPTRIKIFKNSKKHRIYVYTDNMNYRHAIVRIGLFHIKHVCTYYGDPVLELLKDVIPLGWDMIRNTKDKELEELYLEVHYK